MRDVISLIDIEIGQLKVAIRNLETGDKTVDVMSLFKKKGELDGLKRAKDIINNVRRFIETGER